MARLFCSNPPHWWRKGCRFLLASSWLLGLACGLLFCLTAETSYLSVMNNAVYGTVSIVGLLCVTVLPFLLSAFAVFFSRPALFLPVCFCRAFLLSAVSFGVMQAFGSAGWLIRWLLLFSSSASVPLLYWYWLHHLSGERRFSLWETILLFALLVLIGSFEYRIIIPFLTELIVF